MFICEPAAAKWIEHCSASMSVSSSTHAKARRSCKNNRLTSTTDDVFYLVPFVVTTEPQRTHQNIVPHFPASHFYYVMKSHTNKGTERNQWRQELWVEYMWTPPRIVINLLHSRLCLYGSFYHVPDGRRVLWVVCRHLHITNKRKGKAFTDYHAMRSMGCPRTKTWSSDKACIKAVSGPTYTLKHGVLFLLIYFPSSVFFKHSLTHIVFIF